MSLVSATPHQVLAIDGVDRPFDVARYGDDVFVDSPLGPVQLVALPASRIRRRARARSLLAPMPGSVLRIGAAVGDTGHRGPAADLAGSHEDGAHRAAPGDGVLGNSTSNRANRSTSAPYSPV